MIYFHSLPLVDLRDIIVIMKTTNNLMNIIRIIRSSLVLFLVMLNLACGPFENIDNSTPGNNVLFIGHSFFRPVADGIDEHADRSGIIGHTQQIVFSGGATGSPQGLWENASKKAEIQAILDSGNINLLGMTYHPDFPDVDGYSNWTVYALQQNPKTKFFIALPWLTEPASLDSATYASTWVNRHPSATHRHIDTLRAIHSNNEFYCIPYGEGAGELYKLYEEGNLTDVQSLVRQGGNAGIFSDTFGHPDNILIDLSQLIWLKAIYKVDLGSYNYNHSYVIDLKMIATDIIARHESNYNAL